METVYDWLTVALFCVIAVIFLQRSVGPERPGDSILRYVPPAAACAGANWLGNNGHHVWAIALMVGVAGYMLIVLRPGRGLR